MMRQMLRAKIHRITVTERDLEYEGSLTLDSALMEACGMVRYERVDVYDITNGSRFSTYLIEGKHGGGACCVNGAAAHMVGTGDRLILAAYCSVHEEAVTAHRPKVIVVDGENRITTLKDQEQFGVRVQS